MLNLFVQWNLVEHSEVKVRLGVIGSGIGMRESESEENGEEVPFVPEEMVEMPLHCAEWKSFILMWKVEGARIAWAGGE